MTKTYTRAVDDFLVATSVTNIVHGRKNTAHMYTHEQKHRTHVHTSTCTLIQRLTFAKQR